MNNLEDTLHDIKDRCFVYSIMLAEASSSLGKMKMIFKLPTIFISIILSVLNSSKFNETEEISIINTIMNAFIALMIGIENTLQLDNKRQVFTTTKNKFEKLHSNIEKRLLNTSEPLSLEFVQNSIGEFEQIDDDLTFDIPKSIREKARKTFTGTRTLPLILGGEKVNHKNEIDCKSQKELQYAEPDEQAKIGYEPPKLSNIQNIPLRPQQTHIVEHKEQTEIENIINQISHLPDMKPLSNMKVYKEPEQVQMVYDEIPIISPDDKLSL